MDTRVLRLVNIMGAVAASAALFFFGTGLHPVAALTWLAPLPVLLLAPRVGPRAAVAAAFLAYLLGGANSWRYFLHSLSVPLPAAVLILLGSALVFALATLLFRRLLSAGRPLLATIAMPAVWVTAVYTASLANPTGVMGTLATTQTDTTAVLQIASITGAWGVEFLVLMVPAAIAAGVAPGVATRARLRTGVVTVAALGFVVVFGTIRASDMDSESTSIRVATLARTDPHWAVDVSTPAGRALITSYVDKIAGLPDEVRMVVLPEASFAADDNELPALVEPMSSVARDKRIEIVVGLITGAGPRRFNTALDIRPGHEPLAYHKWHTAGEQKIQSGHELAVSDRVGFEVCMDVNFAAPSRDYAREGAGLVAIPASDEDADGWQHSRTALLRAVENGFGVAWSAQRGVPMLADSRGHVLAETNTGTSAPFALVIADVPAGTGPTFYARFGDWFAWLCVALMLAGLASVKRGGTAQQDRRAGCRAG